MSDIFSALQEDHDKQRELIRALCDTSGASDSRQRLFDDVVEALKAHARAEERFFYVPLMESDMTQEKSRHSVAEHHEMDEMLEELAATDLSSPHWLATAKQLQERLLHHLEEEEVEVFPVAGKVLSDADKQQLAVAYQDAMEEGEAMFDSDAVA